MAILHDGDFSLEIEIIGAGGRGSPREIGYRFTPRYRHIPLVNRDAFRTDESLFGQGYGGFVGADWDSPDLLCTFQAALDSDEMQLWELGFDASAQVAIFPHRRFPHFFERDSECFTVIVTPANIQHKDWQGAEGTNRGIAAILTPSEDEFRRFVAQFTEECAVAGKITRLPKEL